MKAATKELEEKFGKMSSTSCGPEFDLLGMKISFKDGKVCINMKSFLRKAVQEF